MNLNKVTSNQYNGQVRKSGSQEVCILPLHITIARGFFARARGLLGRPTLAKDEALLLPQTSWVHTWGMRFAIDVLILNQEGYIKKIVDDLPPGKMTGAFLLGGQTLELAAGRRQELGLEIGDQIYVDPKIS